MSMSEVYTDTVGSIEAPVWPRSYTRAHAITRSCPTCGAAPYQLCSYSPARERLTPCFARMSA